MTHKSKLLNGASLPAVQFAEQYRKTVIKPKPEGMITAPLRKEGPAIYRVED